MCGGNVPLIGRAGYSQVLPGLPDVVAGEVVAGRLGRALTRSERAAVTRLAGAVDGQPLRLQQAAAMAAADEHHLTELADIAERDPAELDRLSVGSLAGTERRLLASLSLLTGLLLPRDVLEAILDLERLGQALTDLWQRGLADHDADRFGLPVCRADSYRQLVGEHLDLAATVRDLIAYLAAADPTSDQSVSAVNAALALIRYAAERGEWTAVARLVEAIEPLLILSSRWQAATQALDLGRQAARAIGDRTSEALFAHERGTLALCQDQPQVAAEQLSRALELREDLGDRDGAALTRHNLSFMTAAQAVPPPGKRLPPPPPPPAAPPQPPPSPRRRRLLRRVTTLALIVVLAIVGIGSFIDSLPDRSGGSSGGGGGSGNGGGRPSSPAHSNRPPTVTIVAPSDGDVLYLGHPVTLFAEPTDPDDADDSRLCSSLTWRSSRPEDPFPVAGCEATVTFSTTGPRDIRVTGSDPQGSSADDTVRVEVVINQPPEVQITAPASPEQVDLTGTVALSATATDPEGDQPLEVQWTASLENSAPIVIGSSVAVDWTPEDSLDLSPGFVSISLCLTVTDPFGNTGSDSVLIEKNYQPTDDVNPAESVSPTGPCH